MNPNPDTPALTFDEWNAAYFLGLESIFKRECQCNVPEQVREGVRILANSGYRFRFFDGETMEPVPGYRTSGGTIERPCEDIADGTFDVVSRARDAVHWLTDQLPQMSTEWLEELIKTYDQLHPS